LCTKELAMEIAEGMSAVFFVAADIKRSKIDFNRPPEEAFIDPGVKKYYQEYHNKLREYVDRCLEQFGRCFLLDVHGFSTRSCGDYHVIFGTGCYSSLAGDVLGQFNRKLIKKGWKVLHKHTGYFSGGYIIRQYAKPPVVGVQMEVCKDIRLDNVVRRRFAVHVAGVLKSILKVI